MTASEARQAGKPYAHYFEFNTRHGWYRVYPSDVGVWQAHCHVSGIQHKIEWSSSPVRVA